MTAIVEIYSDNGGHETLAEADRQRIMAALIVSAESLERDARSRKHGGDRLRDARAMLRAEARRVRQLARRIEGESS